MTKLPTDLKRRLVSALAAQTVGGMSGWVASSVVGMSGEALQNYLIREGFADRLEEAVAEATRTGQKRVWDQSSSVWGADLWGSDAGAGVQFKTASHKFPDQEFLTAEVGAQSAQLSPWALIDDSNPKYWGVSDRDSIDPLAGYSTLRGSAHAESSAWDLPTTTSAAPSTIVPSSDPWGVDASASASDSPSLVLWS